MVASKRRKIIFFIFWPVLVISFILAAFFVVLLANGYRLDQDSWRLEKTGTIVLNGPSSGGKVNLDGIDKGDLPISIKMLSAGRHEVIVTKDGYQTWTKVFNVLAGRAILVDNLTLFFAEPKITKLEKSQVTSLQINRDFKAQGSSVVISGDEVWFRDKLVTRFSQEILGAIYDQNTQHLFVQLGSEIWAVNMDNLNQFKIIQLSKNELTNFSISGRDLFYADSGELYQAEIR